ncbi:MAG: hypothetical protein HC810_01270 [Acaryochloridaceae cyanobacterium RL_2_7]|nr:hypothetical protein [Acaryochloridaceae cyanobacterium RL_2_7]
MATTRINERTYTRTEILEAFGLRSKATLTRYCKVLDIPLGLHYFTQAEFRKLELLRKWRLRGGLYRDYFKYNDQDACA